VIIIYIPCLAWVLSLAREFGYMKALETIFAIVLGGIAFRALGPILQIMGLSWVRGPDGDPGPS